MTEKNKSIIFFAIYPLVAVWFSFALDLNALFSTLVFYGLPAIILSFLKPGFIRKALYFSLLSIPAIIVVDYIAEVSGSWLIPTSVLPKLFGLVSVEVMSWAYLHFFAVVMFYEYFFDKRKRSKVVYPQSKRLFKYSLVIFALFLLLVVFSKDLRILYWYAIFSFVFILPPVIIEEYNYPKVFIKLLKVGAYFFYLNLAYELTALKIGWWSFPGDHYIGWVSFFNISFPFEEFFFWIVLFTIAILSYYEYYFDREV